MPRRLWAVEAILSARQEHGHLPTFGQAVRIVSELVPCSTMEAGSRVWEALRRGETQAMWAGETFHLDYGPNALTNASSWLRREVSR